MQLRERNWTQKPATELKAPRKPLLEKSYGNYRAKKCCADG
ncbi:hypothetical protein AVEN_46287-1, partial [Araneus ventricosus]